MPKYRFQGKIKAITFKDARVSVLLEDTTFLSNDGDWEQWTDWELIKSGKYKKGEVWVSAFEQSAPEVFQACKMIEKGSEVEVDIFKTEKGFLNINNIRMGVPDKDINEDLKSPEPPEEPQPPWPPGATTEPSSDQRPPDSPEAQDERTSTALDNVAVSREVLIIRQTCIKAASAAVNGTPIDMTVKGNKELVVAIARRLEKYVLEGK
jgi:hypothetical protein